jgi:hypothetical protein
MEFYQHHEVLVSMISFALGFIFDIYTIRRIDNIYGIIQQGIYLLVLGAFLVIEIRSVTSKRNLWQYHFMVVHFLFGALLSLYTIFYYTSASAITSFIYIILLAGLMLANEFGKIRTIGLPVRVTLYAICTLSYFSFVFPILFKRIGPLPFWCGVLSSLSLFVLIWLANLRDIKNVKKEVLYPAIGLHIFFVIGYYTSLIPPVPMAVKKIGVYHQVEKKDGKYIGLHNRTLWDKFAPGPKEYLAREGDKVTILLSIFSPAMFKDQIFLRWYYDHEKNGWSLEDTIPLNISGGRESGYRGFASKRFYKLGLYRVIVETSDGREVGRISVEIKRDTSMNERVFKEDVF